MHSDTETALINAARQGDDRAFSALYSHHVTAAHRTAGQVATRSDEVEDLVSEAFVNVLDLLQRGGGPTESFRAYLLTTVRNLAAQWANRERRISLRADLGNTALPQLAIPFVDTAVRNFERSELARAFTQLPFRWQLALWHTAVREGSTEELADELGMSRNATAALVYRARNGLRRAHARLQSGEAARTRVDPVDDPNRARRSASPVSRRHRRHRIAETTASAGASAHATAPGAPSKPTIRPRYRHV